MPTLPSVIRNASHGYWFAAVLAFLNFALIARATGDDAKFARWEKEIAAFEAADQKQPPPKGGIVFVGSSSIRLWDVKKSFPGLPVINRGFGGSQIEDSTHFFERIVLPYEPSAVVFYAGDNDINSGKSAETVVADFKAFAKKVHERLPNTRLFFISIKPSPSRWKHIETQRVANKLVSDYCEERGRGTKFVDVVKPMLGADGQPREELFVKDRLHMTAEGYAVWNAALRAHLEKIVTGTPRLNSVLTAKRVVFLGDSITYAGNYIAYLEACLTSKFPQQRLEFLNLGLPSETCSGLSEDGHAGGKFPRPDVHERLQRVLDKAKPDLIFACYGMNCGIYLPFDEQRFAKYQEGIRRLRMSAQAAGAPVIHLTPPSYDPTRGGGSRDYNDVLDRYSEWLVSQRADGWMVIDIHGAMNRHLAQRRRWNPKFVLAGDGVHAGPTGHWLMTQTILDAMFAKSDEDEIHELERPWTRDVGNMGQICGIPMPIDPAWDLESLALVSRLKDFQTLELPTASTKASRYDLVQLVKAEGFQHEEKPLGFVTADELLRGEFDQSQLSKFAPNQQAAQLLTMIQRRQRLLTDAWLNEIGHLRPGMSKGLPVANATAQATELNQQIATLAEPAVIELKFKPNAEPFPGKKSDWHGFDRYEFEVAGKSASVVVPKNVAEGKPWVWHGEFFGHKPAPDLALLGYGFHIVYLSVPNMLGCPDAVSHWNSLYRELTRRYGFSSKPALVGLSRGGLYCYNWASANPDKVACIYGDAPVCDFKSWPGGKGKGKGSVGDWKLVLERFHFKNEDEALAWKLNPIDNLDPLAKAKVPLLHVFGDADDVVPWDENTGLIAERYEKLGGKIALIRKPGIGHHPHGLEDSTPIVEFIRKNSPTR